MGIQQITIAGSIVSPDVLTLDSIDFGKTIGANVHVTDWFTAQPAWMTLVSPPASGGTVTSVASRRAASTATLAPSLPTFQRPNNNAADPLFKSRGSVIHDSGGAGDEVAFAGGTFPVGGDFFKVAIVHFAAAPGGTVYPGLSSSTAGNRHLLSADATSFRMRVGASGAEAAATRPFRTGVTCLIGCWNAALKRSRLSIDLGATWGEAINAAAVVDSVAGLQVGHTSDFRWSDQAWGDIDLSDGTEASNALLLQFRKYASEIVGAS